MKVFGSLLILVFIINAVSSATGAKILVAMFMPTPSSHSKSLTAIAGALTRRGHNVTILTSSSVGKKGFQAEDYKEAVHYKFEIPPDLPTMEELEDEFVNLAFGSDLRKQVDILGFIFWAMRHGCECLLDDSATIAKLKASNFDLLIGDSFDGCDALLSHYISLPRIAVTTGIRYPLFNEHTWGIPTPSSYVPFGLLPLQDTMSFFERVASFFEHNVLVELFKWYHFRALNKVKNKHGIAPGKSIPELQADAELWFGMTTFALDFPRPIVPSWIGIGGLTDVPTKPLPADYADFINGSSDHGFILFSLGTYFSELPDPEMTEAFARVFSELPQRVIWRYTGTRHHHLGNNTMLVNWMPQNDLLAHPKARLLIYHGGLAGVYEAIRHGVPMVIMPIFAEQPTNAVRVAAKGMGRLLDKDSISYENVKEAVIEVLGNPSYLQNVKHYSGIYKDTQSKPDETVVFWVEHILKFGGSHLRTRALELNFIQLHSIDVLAFIIVIVLVIMFILFSCCKRCISSCLKNKKTKVE